tara:strand:+ start:37 stop:300 length:264 start_codon:yes stop_codon:yes gene_type:complete
MTKTIILGEQKDESAKKPIQFFSFISLASRDVVRAEAGPSAPHSWKYIELICKNYTSNLDLMFAYNYADNRSSGVLMIGRWNDGVVK